MADKKIDDCLSTKNGHLFIEQLNTVDIVKEYGTPAFVISENQLRRNIRRFQKGFESHWPDGPVKIMPAAKANWISAIQKIIADENCGCDIYSAGEFSVALRAGFDPQFISVNGVPKGKDHIFRAVKEGARITIDGIEEYAVACGKTLREHLPINGIKIKGLMLQTEPGRSLHGNTGIHLTRIMSLKPMIYPIKWKQAAIDTTEFWFTGGRYEHHVYDYIFANKTEQELVEKMDVLGRSCYGDRLFPAIMVPGDLKIGDIMAMLDVGAYQEVSMSNFNAMPRPATLLVNQDKLSVIRQAESEEDVFRRDMIPEHLQMKEGCKPDITSSIGKNAA